MKKTVSVFLALTMVMALCCSAAFAASYPVDSKTKVVDLESAVDANGNPVRVDVLKHTDLFTTEGASRIIKRVRKTIRNSDAGNLEIISNQFLSPSALPATLTFSVGEKVPVYIFVYDGEEWILVDASKDGVIAITLNQAASVALVVERTEEKGSKGRSASGKSPKTGESSVVPACAGIAAAAGAVAVFVGKKKD